MVKFTTFQFEIYYSPNLVFKPGDVIQGLLHVQVGRSAQIYGKGPSFCLFFATKKYTRVQLFCSFALGVWCNLVGKCIISCSDTSKLSRKIVDSHFSPASAKSTGSSISQEVYVNQSLQLLPGKWYLNRHT